MGADGSHNSNVPPPFLTKTYDMVDDAATDEIVSWSENNSSFVVWNVADFAKDLLPHYFKHNNFSSFVRQLNTYGFHKIDPGRWEFANEEFSKGNKESLKSIHRRKPPASHAHISQHLQLQQEHSSIGCADLAHVELEEQIKRLKQDKSFLSMEFVKMQQQRQTTKTELQTLGQRLQGLAERQQQMVAFLTRAMHNPEFFAHLIQQTESSMRLQLSKKGGLPDQEALVGVGESGGDDGRQLVRYHLGGGGDDDDDNMPDAHLTHAEAVFRAELSFEGILRQPDNTSPLSHTSGVTVREIQSACLDPSANDMPAQSVTMSQSEAAECSDYSWKRRDSGDAKAGSTALCINGSVRVKPRAQAPHKKDRMRMVRACGGSNDIFWRNLLTENPCLMDTQADDLEGDGYPCKRQVL